MKTNFQMILENQDYAPQRRGRTSEEEIEMLTKHFGLDKMSVLELQNLRDMVVIVYDRWIDKSAEDGRRDLVDKQSQAMMSITAVIDMFKYKAVAEV
jgi:hypothetical protein